MSTDHFDYNTRKLLSQRTKLREILLELPEICYDFFIAIEPRTSMLTRINYAHDLKLFFYFLKQSLHEFAKPTTDVTIDDIKKIQAHHIEMFLEFLSLYEINGKVRKNGNNGKKRKLSTIRSFYKYLHRHKYIKDDVTSVVDLPKIKEKPIIRLTGEEIIRLLDSVETGANLTKREKSYHKYTKLRDVALLSLLLGTGIRISECVGIDIDDIFLKDNSFKITRKGGNQVILYYPDEIKQVLSDYLEYRKRLVANEGSEMAFFLSMQRSRISAKAVQNLVRKYTTSVTPLKHITPHKFRSTYGTRLYQSTGDIYLVADVLGHRDVNITKKHYAAMSEERRKMAADVTTLRNQEVEQVDVPPWDTQDDV